MVEIQSHDADLHLTKCFLEQVQKARFVDVGRSGDHLISVKRSVL